MGHTVCTESQCLYKGALYFCTVKPWPGLSDCISTIPCKQAYWKHNASFKTALNACDMSVTRWKKELKFSGTWHFVVSWVVPDVTQELGAFSFRGLTVLRTAVWFLKMQTLCPFEKFGTTHRSHNVPSYGTWISRKKTHENLRSRSKRRSSCRRIPKGLWNT